MGANRSDHKNLIFLSDHSKASITLFCFFFAVYTFGVKSFHFRSPTKPCHLPIFSQKLTL